MDIDIAAQIGAVDRKLILREHEGRPAEVIVATRTYDTDIEDLWDALTNAERIPRWFLPVTGELRAGGRYQLEGNAGGRIERCDRPHHLSLTWEFGDQVTWVSVDLVAESAERTRLQLEHIAHTPKERWEQFGPGAGGVGWDLAIALGLSVHLATRAKVDPAEAMAWTMSPEGKAFIEASSDAWCAAAIAAGTPVAEAKKAAANTLAFYTGGGEEPSAPH
jgi:uncharacterized protein YndB with AHSA1/START domain